MPFGNRIINIPDPPDKPRVAFNTLKEGSRYQHEVDGNISVVIEKKDEYMTIRRHDGWLIHLKAGCFTWDKMVIKV
jgi:hypothetical protein